MSFDHEFAGMPITHVHQVLPSLHVADASGSHTLHARDALRKAGFESELFVDQVDPPLASEVRHFDEIDSFVVAGRTALLYQLAVGSRLVDRILDRKEPLLVNYHNLTPGSFYWKWAPDWLVAVDVGRSDLYRLAPRTSHAIAVSKFNEIDLRGAGYRFTSVVPPFVTARRSDARKSKETPTTLLFVGKLLPHKAAHDLVRALVCYREAYDPEARLVLIGGHPIDSYAKAVDEYARALGVEEAVELTGAASEERLAEAYATADVFVCLSDHEGFCFPLVEAMGRGVPIVCYAAGAVPDTLGDAGILLEEKSGPVVASAIHRVVSDRTLRERLVAAGYRRLEDFDLDRTKAHFVEEVRSALSRIDKERSEVARDLGLRGSGSDQTASGPSDVRGVGERWFDAPESLGDLDRLKNKAVGKLEETTAIHQIVPMIVPGDATSEHAIQLRKLLRDMGLESEIFASAIDDSLHSEAMLVHELPDRPLPGTLIVYQMSSGSPLAQLALDRKEPLAINYHNLTPDWAYEGWDPGVAADQRWARRQLVDLARRGAIGICPSSFNAAELSACGFRSTAVCPVLVDMGRLGASASTSESNTRWLFVGRLVPHKGAHRLVEALGIHHKLYGEFPDLDLVGSPGPFRYVDAVKRLAAELGVSDSVHFARGVSDAGLGTFYKNAGVFVSASMHEGFCVPIVEAMHSEVPVVAIGAAAIPETVRDAGVLVDPSGSDPYLAAKIATAVHTVSNDSELRKKLVSSGASRATELGLESARRQMKQILEKWIEMQAAVRPGPREAA